MAKDITYKIKCIRMHEETWTLLKKKRKESGLSWNRFLFKLIDKKSKSEGGWLLDNKI